MIEDSSRDRRSVLRAGAGFVVAAGCLAGMSLRAVRSAAAAAGKPPLTVANVNRLVAADPAGSLAAAGRGLRAFLDENFFLTPEQQRAVDSIGPGEIQKVEEALAKKSRKVRELREEMEKLQKEAEAGGFFGKIKGIARGGAGRLSLAVDERAGQLKIVAQEIAAQP